MLYWLAVFIEPTLHGSSVSVCWGCTLPSGYIDGVPSLEHPLYTTPSFLLFVVCTAHNVHALLMGNVAGVANVTACWLPNLVLSMGLSCTTTANVTCVPLAEIMMCEEPGERWNGTTCVSLAESTTCPEDSVHNGMMCVPLAERTGCSMADNTVWNGTACVDVVAWYAKEHCSNGE